MRSKLTTYQSFRYRYRAWKYRWKTESAEIATVLQFLGPGQVGLDIGGHKGAFTYWMAQRVGPRGRVLTFEPQPELADYLRSVKRTFAFRHVEILEVALSSRTGTATLCRDSEAPSPGATLERASQPKHHQFEVRVDTLDQILTDRGIEHVDFIKCDAEGHELDVFRGSERLLTTSRPPILFECEQRHCQSHEIAAVFDLLDSYGYEGQFFRRGKLRPMSEFHQIGSSPDDADYVYNFLYRAASSTLPRVRQHHAA